MTKTLFVLGLVVVLVMLVVLCVAQEPKKVTVKDAADTKIAKVVPIPPIKEDCVNFNPVTTKAAFVSGEWKVVDGNHWMFSFGNNKAGAQQAVQIIKHYRMNQSCFVGRPDPSFKYMLAGKASPVGSFNGEDCLGFNLATTKVENVGGRWKIVDGSHWIFDFNTNKIEADQSMALIRKYGFNQTCYVARPNPPFSYLRK